MGVGAVFKVEGSRVEGYELRVSAPPRDGWRGEGGWGGETLTPIIPICSTSLLLHYSQA